MILILDSDSFWINVSFLFVFFFRFILFSIEFYLVAQSNNQNINIGRETGKKKLNEVFICVALLHCHLTKLISYF